LEGYAALMHEHWEHKRRRSPGMTNEHIDRLYELARRSGALGGKLVGAGGGGFLLVYTSRPEDTRRAMADADATELAFDFEFSGAYAGEHT
jgi:D-glycero-alpha-D-manno-heptose-7-phosphate kinase